MLNADLYYGFCINEQDNSFLESLAAQTLQSLGCAPNDIHKPRHCYIMVSLLNNTLHGVIVDIHVLH